MRVYFDKFSLHILSFNVFVVVNIYYYHYSLSRIIVIENFTNIYIILYFDLLALL